jgi:hypothetical protein
VLSIPNLRIFVCSAWSDLGRVVDAVGGRHTIMWRRKAPRNMSMALQRHGRYGQA